MKVLIKFVHGLGDVAQFTVVLKHLRKYRPDWVVDVRCGRGKHTALTSLCHRVYPDDEPGPDGDYDHTFDMGWWENYCLFTDKPNSKITNALMEVFGLDWDRTLGRYEIKIGDEAKRWASAYLKSIGATQTNGRFNVVILHYEGNTSQHKKNAAHWQAKAICDAIIAAGRIPVIFDWDKRSALPNNETIFCPAAGYRIGEHELWGKGNGSGDAETIAALESLVDAYIGVDSGPGKVASATETPALIMWMGHHPLQFHDPAPNTIHLVPENHHRIPPVCDNPKMVPFFEKHYRYRMYNGDQGMVSEVKKWLCEVLQVEPPPQPKVESVQYVLPNGIGDTMWALTKIKAIANGDPIDIILSGNPGSDVDHRSVSFLRRFPFIRNISVLDLPVLINREHPTDDKGRYNYHADGLDGMHHYLVPNSVLERGQRLEEWLPEIPTDWSVINDFSFEGTDKGDKLGASLDPFVAFYIGPERGNVDEGHNRGFQWEPRQWNELGQELIDRGFNIAVVGAHYDRSYWERYVRDGVAENGMKWHDLIGQLEIGDTFALLKRAKFFISYQCGLGIVSHYLGGKVAMWWRRDGDSAHPNRLVSFDERMAHCWTNPALADNYIPLIYRRETVQNIVDELDKEGVDLAMTDSIRVLLRFVSGFGLGDLIQASILLKHLRRYRPHWIIDVRTAYGAEAALVKVCNRVFSDAREERKYDSIIDLDLHEQYTNRPGRPSSKVADVLVRTFGIQEYDMDLGRYECHVTEKDMNAARCFFWKYAKQDATGKFNAVIIHYQGGSSIGKKDLAEWQANELAQMAIRAGRVPFILDWSGKSGLPDGKTIISTKEFGHGHAGTIAAMIRCVEAYVGIDSGPGKIASTTDTPTLIIWTQFHPLRYHDPAPNTMHMVPEEWDMMEPIEGDEERTLFFKANYQFLTYHGEHGLVAWSLRWLAGILGCSEELTSIRFVIPPGIGSACWALTKIQGIAQDRPIDLAIAGDRRHDACRRSVEFLKHFPMVHSVKVENIPLLNGERNSRGRNQYVADGIRGTHHYLIPNGMLETGRRLEEWLPEHPTDWRVFEQFDWTGSELGKEWGKSFAPFVAFQIRDMPGPWFDLSTKFFERGLKICLVGFSRSHLEKQLLKISLECGLHWIDMVGRMEIASMMAFLKQSTAFITCQSGLGVAAHYLGVPTAMFWEGEPGFDERMGTAWVNPGQDYLPLTFGREQAKEIVQKMEEKGWLA